MFAKAHKIACGENVGLYRVLLANYRISHFYGFFDCSQHVPLQMCDALLKVISYFYPLLSL